MTTTQPRKLVRLRTAPMPDPGEWCEHIDRPRERDCPMFESTYYTKSGCSCGYIPVRSYEPIGYRRPQSCIDAAEEVET